MKVILTPTRIDIYDSGFVLPLLGTDMLGARIDDGVNRREDQKKSDRIILIDLAYKAEPFELNLAAVENLPRWSNDDAGARLCLEDIRPIIRSAPVAGGVPPKNSIEFDAGQLQLVGDQLAPGADMVYGTDGAGAKGWKADPSAGGMTDLTGDVTGTGPGSTPTTIAANAVTTAKIINDAVTNAKLANMAQATIKGRAAGSGTGDPQDLTADQTSTILDGAADPFLRTSATGGGDVIGPASAVDDNIALFDGTTGKLIKDAGINLSEIIEEDPGAGIGMIESGAGVSPIILKNIKDGQGTQVINNTGSVQTDIHFSTIDQYFYSDVSGNPLEGTITAAGRNLIDDATVADQRTTLGLNPTAKGNIISASAANTPVLLPVGLDNQVLKSRAAAASGLEWGNAELRILIHPQANALTNQPNTPELLTPGIPGVYITRQNLTGYRQAKILVHVLVSSASGNSPRIILRYATTYTLVVGSFLDIGTSEVSASFSSVGVIQSSWIDLAAGALGDVYIAAVTDGGNGWADPTIVMTTAIFR